ncbi:MAG: helix-turn-helix transcriptional regulator [Clostridia bacterium]|nr:helix-turn-helix transcriptional regulator [Clostridia bacterium]
MKLNEKRVLKGLQQKEVMKDVGLYSKIENGKAIAVEPDCERFAQLFGCELEDLFEEKELLFFKRLLSLEKGHKEEGKEFADQEPKIVSAPICKSQKRHIELTRKCYWLNRTRSERLKQIIHKEGFKTEQDWYSYIVDREIEKAARSTAMETSGQENICNEIIAQSEGDCK